jgi:hypothetical protein
MKQLAFFFSALFLVLTVARMPAQAQMLEPPTPTATSTLSGGAPVLPSSATITATETLTATAIITPTATPRPTYLAPILAIPTMWTTFYGQNTDITFAWISPAQLQANEWFVIYLQWSYDPAQGEWSPWCLAAWTKDTEFVSTGEMRQQYGGCLREATSGVGRGIQWFVVIQTMSSGGFSGNLSPESNRLIYIWEPYSPPSSLGPAGIAPTTGILGPSVAAVPATTAPTLGTAPSTLASPAAQVTAAPTPNPDDPNLAKTITGAASGTLAPQAAVWYRFEYANNHQTGGRPWVNITLLNGNGSGVAFAVYAPENINGWWENRPTGRGTVQMVDCQTGQPSESGECQSSHLLWQGNFGMDGTYWIRVVNNNNVPTDYALALTLAEPEP